MRSLMDRLVFAPDRDPLDPGDRQRVALPLESPNGSQSFELWGWNLSGSDGPAPGWVILKFPGTGGRAERAGDFPAGLLASGSVRGVWTVNPPGYGSSPGRPTLASMTALIDAAVRWTAREFPGARLLVTGNSLGTVWALAAAARHGAGLMVLRNPLPLRQMIAGRWRYNWWNLGMARFWARQIPDSLDAVENARLCRAPCLVIQSGADRLVPPAWQRKVIEALGGPTELLSVPGLDHGDPLPEEREPELVERFQRLVRAVTH